MVLDSGSLINKERVIEEVLNHAQLLERVSYVSLSGSWIIEKPLLVGYV